MGQTTKRNTKIQISVDLAQALKKIGTMGDTYETLIWKLLEHYKAKKY